jgi:hypothetical protein
LGSSSADSRFLSPGEDLRDIGGVELVTVRVENTAECEAMRYLEDQAYAAMLGYKEPVRSGEILGAIANDRYSAKLIRHVLAASNRFAQIDRRWDLEIRYEDKQRPMERVLNEIMAVYGHPMSVQEIANELSSVYERPADYYEAMLPRVLNDKSKYFGAINGRYGLRRWIFDLTSDEESDLLFDNDVEAALVESLENAAARIDWASDDITGAVDRFIDLVGEPVSNLVIGLFRWRAIGDAFDPEATYDKLDSSPELVWISDHRWANRKITCCYDSLLADMADHLSEEVTEDVTPIVVERKTVEEEIAPSLSLTISERDLDEVAQIVSAKGDARLPAILENIFEISPRDPVYAVAAEGLSDAMRVDSRFV